MYLKDKDVTINLRISNELDKMLHNYFENYKKFAPTSTYSDYLRCILESFTLGNTPLKL